MENLELKDIIKFNPEKDYSWNNNDEFTLYGKEFEIAHNTLSAIFNTSIPEAQMYMMLNEIYKITSLILKRNVESGKIKETEPLQTRNQIN